MQWVWDGEPVQLLSRRVHAPEASWLAASAASTLGSVGWYRRLGTAATFCKQRGRAMETLINLIIDVWMAPIVD
jgi:hypothetical protein